jgi:ABC-type nitrate/sulfonate/bicarbonate transport system substrate-binding protein
LIPLKSGKEIRQAIASGWTDVALTNAINFLVLSDLGAPVKMLFPCTLSSIVVFVRPDGEIQTFDDLKGKKIYGALGQSWFVFTRVLKEHGILESDFEFVDIDKDYRGMALLQQKIIDAIPTNIYNEGPLEELGAIRLKQWEEEGYSREVWPATFIGVNTDYLNSYSDRVETFIDVMIETQKFIVNNQEEAAELISKHINEGTVGVANFSPDRVLESWQKGVKYTMWFDTDILIDMAKFISEGGQTKSNISLEQMFDFRFIEKIRSAQKEIYGSEN